MLRMSTFVTEDVGQSLGVEDEHICHSECRSESGC